MQSPEDSVRFSPRFCRSGLRRVLTHGRSAAILSAAVHCRASRHTRVLRRSAARSCCLTVTEGAQTGGVENWRQAPGALKMVGLHGWAYALSVLTLTTLISVLLAPVAEASLVIAIRTPGRIIIAADSQFSTTSREPQGMVCKIRNFGDIVFASSGYRTPPVYDLTDSLRQVGSSGVRSRIASLEEQTKLSIDEDRSILRRVGVYGLNYLFGFFDGDESVVRVRKFHTGTDEEYDEDVKYIWIGDHQLYRSAPSTFERALEENVDIYTALASIINAEAAVSDLVGGLVDIFELTAEGGRWIALKPGCRERE